MEGWGTIHKSENCGRDGRELKTEGRVCRAKHRGRLKRGFWDHSPQEGRKKYKVTTTPRKSSLNMWFERQEKGGKEEIDLQDVGVSRVNKPNFVTDKRRGKNRSGTLIRYAGKKGGGERRGIMTTRKRKPVGRSRPNIGGKL